MSEVQEVQQGQELDRKDLKIMGYRQKLAERDEQFNELQVDYTVVSEQLNQAAQEIGRLNEVLKEAGLDAGGDPVEDAAAGVSTGDVSKD